MRYLRLRLDARTRLRGLRRGGGLGGLLDAVREFGLRGRADETIMTKAGVMMDARLWIGGERARADLDLYMALRRISEGILEMKKGQCA